MKKILALVLLSISLSSFSQFKLTGKIVDEQNEPLPFANVLLYKVNDSNDPRGQISDNEGNFMFKDVASGSYKIRVSMLCFKTKKIEEFTLEADKEFTIILKEES